MALSSPNYRSRPAAGRNRRKSELTPLFVPRLSEWREAMTAQDPEVAARLVRAKRVVWAWCYVVGFGSGLLTARLVRSVPVPAAATATAPGKKTAGVKSPAQGKKAVPAATPTAKDPVVTIREVKR